jgi:AraC family transcriptional regulator
VDDVTRGAVRRVIESMCANLDEQLTVDEMARTAMFSKFHFSRVFQRVTGVPPGRFLAALRLQRAKQLLESTSLSVTEISHRVGYSSVGTFSSRFSSSVGVSPRTYRRLGELPAALGNDKRRGGARPAAAMVHGEVRCPGAGDSGAVFVGLFPDPLSEGRPPTCAVLPGPGPYTLDDAPPGRWHVRAHRTYGSTPAVTSVGSMGPVILRPGAVVRADLWLRPMGTFDPPVLVAHLDGRRPLQAADRTRIGRPPRIRSDSIGSGTTR